MRKSLLKTVAATAVVGAVMMMSSVAAWAEATDHVFEYYVDYDSTGKNATVTNTKVSSTSTDGYFTESSESYTQLATSTYLAEGSTLTVGDKTFNGSYKLSSTANISFTPKGTASVEVYYLGNHKSKISKVKLTSSDENLEDSNDNGAGAYSDDPKRTYSSAHSSITGLVADTKYTVGYSNGQPLIYYIKVTDNYDESSTVDYSLSGHTNLPNASFRIGNYTVETDANGDWEHIVNAATSPFEVGAELAVSLTGYSATPSNVTISAVEGSETAFEVNDIEFEEIPFEEIKEGTYGGSVINVGHPNFETTGKADLSGEEIKFSNNGTISFKLSKEAKVTVTGRSDNNDKTVNFDLTCGEYSETNQAPAKDENKTYGDYEYLNVPAGTATLTINGTASYIKAISIEYVEEDTTPYLDLVATQNADKTKARLEATINNVSADNKITSISVKRNDRDAATDVKNIKKANGVYSFAVNFGTPANDTHAVLSLTFLKGGKDSTTKTYEFDLFTDNTIELYGSEE